MPDRPLLILPAPSHPALRRKKQGGGGHIHLPPRARQDARITPQFTVLQKAFESRRMRVQAEVAGIVPEEVIVLETVGSIENFAHAVKRIEGLEWLGEIEEEEIPPDDDFFAQSKKGARQEGKSLRGRLFLVFTSQQALQQILSLWTEWKSGRALARGFSKWGDVFGHLRDIRPWGVRERFEETGILEDWKERSAHRERVVPCEIELWFRNEKPSRQSSAKRVSRMIKALGGDVLTESVIEEISYHAILASIPIVAVEPVLAEAGRDAELLQCEQIQFFRASGQMLGSISIDTRTPDPRPPGHRPRLGEPVVALLDGLPIQNHQRLAGRLMVDDPDDVGALYPVAERLHGTAMASLIVHGDLDAGESPLPRELYVRPILQPDPHGWYESRREIVAESRLVVDLIHGAVRRLFEPTGDTPPVAPRVCVINLSIGIRDRPFDQAMSPLGRLLDWLAWKYRVLFVVSAGNHSQALETTIPRRQLKNLDGRELQAEVINVVAADVRNRRLLSPAEAVNALTVGAMYADASKSVPLPYDILPLIDNGLPSPISAQGMGYRRGIKPDILFPGGRFFVQESLNTTTNAVLTIQNFTRPPGQRVAAPGSVEGDLSASCHTRGTSNAAAIASRTAGILYEQIQDLKGEPGGETIGAVPAAIWLKALLVHSASWGEAKGILSEILRNPTNGRKIKEYLTRLLGYGTAEPGRVRECTPIRVTALSGATIGADQSYVHRFPLPPSLSGQRGHRRLVVTLAWLTPVNPGHQAWRRADLWFHPDPSRPPGSGDSVTPLRLSRAEADFHTVQRGTLQHEILTGVRAAAFTDGEDITIQVSCREAAGSLEDTVPYALAVTLEVAPELGIDIYEEVRTRVRARVRVSSGVSGVEA